MQDVQQPMVKKVIQVYQQIPPTVVYNNRKIATRIQKVKSKRYSFIFHLFFSLAIIESSL